MKILNIDFGFGSNSMGFNDHALLNILELQKHGNDITWVTCDATPMVKNYIKNTSTTIQEDIPVNIHGIKTHVLHCKSPALAWYCPGASKLAKKIIKDYDVVHIRNWYDHLSFTFSRAAHRYNIPYVFTSHGTIHAEARKRYNRTLKLFVDKIYTKKMLLGASALHSTGESEAIEFIKAGVQEEKIFRIKVGILLDDFKIKQRTNILERLNIDKKEYVLFLSRIDKKKGIELLLNAFAKLNMINVILVIAGSGNKEYEEKIKKQVKKLRLEKSVKFAGFVNGYEKLQLLESAKLFVLPSYSDVTPMSITEALTMGVPALVTKNCDYPEIEKYNAGIIVEATVESIFQGLIKILNNKNNFSTLSNNAKKLVAENFVYDERKINKYEEMYNYAVKKYKL